MVTLRTEAEFVADFPDDTIEEDGDIVQFPGRAVAEAIGAMLAGHGYKVSAPMHAGEHGWELGAAANGRRFWIAITLIEEYRLKVWDTTWRFWRASPSLRDFLGQLDGELRRDGRFHQIGWFEGEEDETRSPHPAG